MSAKLAYNQQGQNHATLLTLHHAILPQNTFSSPSRHIPFHSPPFRVFFFCWVVQERHHSPAHSSFISLRPVSSTTTFPPILYIWYPTTSLHQSVSTSDPCCKDHLHNVESTFLLLHHNKRLLTFRPTHVQFKLGLFSNT